MPTKPISPGRAYWLLITAAYRAQLQYRGNFLMITVGGLAYQGIGLAFVWVLVEQFGSLGHWTMGEIAFLYGMRLTAHALWTVPMNQLNLFDWVLREGEFDRYLVRPVGPLMQLLTRKLSVEVAGDMIGGLGLLIAAACVAPVDWSAAAVGMLFAAVVGGAMVEASLQLFICSFSFRVLSTRTLRFQIDGIFNNFGGYPLKVFPSGVRFALTFLMPLAFVAYLPATALLERTDELSVSPWLATSAPLAGPVLLALAYQMWRLQLRHHTSTGT
ncbi:ABC transporter permease [Streptomyces sp. NPDC102381]|uniref:ABC transporter permease n=1 Tax=Streptomyces sp. NPDC102381 TaxID=3366164 RepID=UPI00381EBC08